MLIANLVQHMYTAYCVPSDCAKQRKIGVCLWNRDILTTNSHANTLPDTNIARENRPFQKETSFPIIHFQVRAVSFREGTGYRKDFFKININTAPFFGLFRCQALLKVRFFLSSVAASVMSWISLATCNVDQLWTLFFRARLQDTHRIKTTFEQYRYVYIYIIHI